MFPSRSRAANTLGGAVDTLLGLLTPPAMNVLLEMQEDELDAIQGTFTQKLCDYLDLEEDDLLDLCVAEDLDAAAANLIKATWSEARKRCLH